MKNAKLVSSKRFRDALANQRTGIKIDVIKWQALPVESCNQWTGFFLISQMMRAISGHPIFSIVLVLWESFNFSLKFNIYEQKLR